MPELAEVRIMSDYINEVCSGKIFNNIRKSQVSKVKTSIYNPFETWKITSKSRGKELKLIFTSSTGEQECMICSMGMSGHFALTRTEKELKHSHLMFDTITGITLSLVDVRRFAKWKWGDWNFGRSPDPVQDFENFKKNIESNINHKDFLKPIGEILMSQTYFNGLGNYLRAEILYKTEQNPFQSAKEAILNNKKLLTYCKQIPEEAYNLGGGELRDWHNPLKSSNGLHIKDWMQCYSKKNMSSVVDGSGRRLWFDPIWNSSIPENLKDA